MRRLLSAFLALTLAAGASIAFAGSRKDNNSVDHASGTHRNRNSTSRHRSSGSHRRSTNRSTTRTHSNVPVNPN